MGAGHSEEGGGKGRGGGRKGGMEEREKESELFLKQHCIVLSKGKTQTSLLLLLLF